METKIFNLLLCIAMLAVGGCGSQRTAPHVGFGNFEINAELSRDDIVVLDRVEGTSTTDSFFFGIIQIVDGEELKLFGSANTEFQAYYKALETTPDADAVFYKSVYKKCSGLPPFLWTDTVTYSGKAIQLKTDHECHLSETSETAENIKGYRATIDEKTGKPVSRPVYEDEK